MLNELHFHEGVYFLSSSAYSIVSLCLLGSVTFLLSFQELGKKLCGCFRAAFPAGACHRQNLRWRGGLVCIPRAVVSSDELWAMDKPCWPGGHLSALTVSGLEQVWRWMFSTHSGCNLPSLLSPGSMELMSPVCSGVSTRVITVFHKLWSLILSSAGKEKDQNNWI